VRARFIAGEETMKDKVVKVIYMVLIREEKHKKNMKK
jgi:hypothetical protein